MSVILVAFLFSFMLGASICHEAIFSQYLNKCYTMQIQGIFVFFVFLRHYIPYAKINGSFDSFALWLNAELGQCIVAIFLFYSGYGISQGISNKGKVFLNNLPLRALKVL